MFKSLVVYSELQILKQDEGTLSDKPLTLRLPNLKNGPSNNYIFIAQKEAIATKGSDNNFSSSPEFMQFSSINVFGVSYIVMEMFDKDMQYLKDKIYQDKSELFNDAFNDWENRGSIGIFPHDQPDQANAYYTNTGTGGELHFFSFYEGGNQIHTSRCFDVIAHEMGHAILDILRPDLNKNDRLQTKGLHESFGDLTAIFAILNIPELRKDVLKATKGDLHNESFLSMIAESFNNRKGLREANNKILINKSACEEHDLSRVFTGAVYAILAKSFESLKLLNADFSLDDLLEIVQEDLRRIVLRAFIEVPYSNPSFSDVGKMLEDIAAQNLERLEYIHQHIRGAFSERSINTTKAHKEDDWCDPFNSQKTSSASGFKCGTLNHLWSSKPKETAFSDLDKNFSMLNMKQDQSSSKKSNQKAKGFY